MKRTLITLFAALLYVALCLSGCAAYKQLEPEPLIGSQEQAGYTEIKKGEKEFVIKKDKKYFIEFPLPAEKNFYLVLNLPERKSIECMLVSEFDRANNHGPAIKDETASPENLCVYPVSAGMAGCFWLIDQVVPEEMTLRVKYRYVPQWRFKFENKYAEYLATLKKNMVNRQTYQSIGSVKFDAFPFQLVSDSVTQHLNELKKVQAELLAIQSIFPPSIVNSSDKAYLNYVALKKELEEEMAFQESYLLALGFFSKEFECRNNPLCFLDKVNDFIGYFGQKARLGTNVFKESQGLVEKRLAEMVPYYEQLFTPKTDALPLDSTAFRISSFYKLDTLYKTAEVTEPFTFTDLAKFFAAFDTQSRKLVSVKEVFRTLAQTIKDSKGMPSDDFFPGIASKAAAALKETPAGIDQTFGKYQTYPCVTKLNQDLDKIRQEGGRRLMLYREADSLVKQLNVLKAKADYPGMLALLKQKPHLDFLMDKYQELDKLSVDAQTKSIKTALDAGDWGRAEGNLTKLHQDNTFLNLQTIAPVKRKAVEDLEDTLYSKVNRLTRERVDKFCEEKVHVLENIDSLYMDSVFLPAYNITFSSGGKNELIQRQAELVAHLAKLKENEFPLKAVKILYDEFVKNPEDDGVLKARAIVAHGKHYTGKDKDVATRVKECDPQSPKWITKPTDYRRVFVLPVTDNRTGRNKYFLRLNIQVPSEAKFPVYDVNLKLPREVAGNAAETKWYKQLLMNGKELKNEGRFSITAPTSSNNYECQITPVQMVKDGENYLDVTFEHKSFKVYSVSVMVQKPIIKKN